LHRSPKKFVARRLAAAAVSCLGIAACGPAASTSGEATEPEPAYSVGCGAEGAFQARLYGAIAAELAWSSPQYECRGMPRPDGQGVRLFFAGLDAASGERLAFILAIPGFDRDATGREFDSTLTVIEEGSGRFFSTALDASCVTDIAAIDTPGPDAERLAVHGAVFCVAPLAEVNGDSSVSIAELSFAGMLDWDAS
jgi:hypothetical protein